MWKHKYHKWNTEALVNSSREVGLEVKAGRTKCVFVSRHQTKRQNRNIKLGDKSYEKCGKDQAFWNEDNKSELHSREY
jgi:hypothetical protein